VQPDQIHPITGLPVPSEDPGNVPPRPEPKPLTRAEKLAAARKAATAAANARVAAAKEAAAKKAADRAAAKQAAEKAAADKAAADADKAAAKAADVETTAATPAPPEPKHLTKAQRLAAARKTAREAAAKKAAAAKEAAQQAAAEKAATQKSASEAEKSAVAEKPAADKKTADAAADKALADKASPVPPPTTVAVPSASVVTQPDAPVIRPAAPARPTVVTMPSATVPTEAETPAVSPAPPVMPSVESVQPPAAKPQPAPAATVPPAPAPASGLAKIIFLGAEPFTPAELTPVTGLALGDNPTSESVQKASQRLIDTGLFSNVAASYDLQGALGTATFTLKPAGPYDLVRPSFANFVWLTPAEIDTALNSVPFYHGLVPVGGSLHMATDIETALAAALKARGVTATITHTLVPPSALHPYAALEFRVTDPDTVLETAQLFDVPPALIAKALKAQDDAVKIPYNEGVAGATITDVLLAPARDAGYLGARLYHIEKKRKSMRSTVYIDYAARMDVGPVYTVRALNWTPDPVYTAADFKRDCALHIGQKPSPEAAAKTRAAILASYHAQGYLEADVTSTYNLAPAGGAVDYTFTAAAGPQYHLHTLTVHGLDPQAQKDFDGAWTIQPGDIYNEGFVLNFLKNHRNIASLSGYTFDYNRNINPETHDVDLTLTFKPAK
jgi:outer membrane protein insertion porin family